MRVWLDDERPMPPGFDFQAKTAQEAISLLSQGKVKFISLDHDLGPPEAGDGTMVAKWIEENAFHGKLKPLEWEVHSANPVGRQNMTMALKKAEQFWNSLKEQFHRIGKNGGQVWGKEGAGILYVTQNSEILLLKRSPPSDHSGTWGLPGGKLKSGETPIDGAIRETKEECGTFHSGQQFHKYEEKNGLHKFTVFFYSIPKLFNCKLSKEHNEYKWVKINEADQLHLHPKLKEFLPYYKKVIQKRTFRDWVGDN
jgi:mutator protein MutT